jgi:hypothetical protein
MAQFPIQYNQMTPSGRGVNPRAHLDTSTGGEDISRGLINLGGAIRSVEDNIRNAQDASELSTIDRKIHENWNAEYSTLQTTQDPEARVKLHEKAMQDRQQIALSSKRSNVIKAAKINLDSYEPSWDVHFNGLDREMKITSAKFDYKTNLESAINLENYSAAEKYTGLAIHTGLINPDEAEFDLQRAKGEIDYRKTVSMAESFKTKEEALNSIEASAVTDKIKDSAERTVSAHFDRLNKKAGSVKFDKDGQDYKNTSEKLRNNDMMPDDIGRLGLGTTEKTQMAGWLKNSQAKDFNTATTSQGYSSLVGVITKYSNDDAEMNKNEAYRQIYDLRYGKNSSISDKDFKWAIDKLDNKYPKALATELQATLEDNKANYHGWWESGKESEDSKTVNQALVEWVDKQDNPPSKEDMYKKSMQLRNSTQPVPKTEQPDYDMAGAQAAGVKPDERGHYTDEYKLPNHITFSTDSKYSKEGQIGGEWKQEGKKWDFHASSFNLQQHSKEQMVRYFIQAEPDSKLVFPDGSILDPKTAYPKTEAEYNKLPSNSIWINESNEIKRKK